MSFDKKPVSKRLKKEGEKKDSVAGRARRPYRAARRRTSSEELKAEKRRLTLTHRGSTAHLKRELGAGRYIIFDIESTGGNPGKNGITEIFALKVENGVVKDTFYSMVNPKMRIPPIVRKMTGITNQMVKNEPPIEDVMPSFCEFIGSYVLVSHNTIGDMRFLRYFSEQTTGKMIDNYYLCTHLLTEKLLPDEPNKSLKGLGEGLKLPVKGKLHRAESDTYLTYELFKVLLKRLFESDVVKIEDAIRFQGDYESGLRLGWGVDKKELSSLPAGCGVFFLHDRRGKVLYLASSKNIFDEVHKLKKLGTLPRQLLKSVLGASGVSYKECEDLFSASLLEAKSLIEHPVRYGPSDVHQRVSQFLYLCREDKDVYVLSSGFLKKGVSIALGPIRSGKDVGGFLEKIAGVFGKKLNRKGLFLDKKEADILFDFLDVEKDFDRSFFEPLQFGLWLLPSYRARKRDRKVKEQKLQKLLIPKELKPIKTLSGFMGVQQKEGWVLMSIFAGMAREEGFFAGRLSEAFVRKEASRLLPGVEKSLKSVFKKPMTAFEAHLTGRVTWWLCQGGKGRETVFVPLDKI